MIQAEQRQLVEFIDASVSANATARSTAALSPGNLHDPSSQPGQIAPHAPDGQTFVAIDKSAGDRGMKAL